MSERILVTGGAGFLGAHLCRSLIERGCSVRVIDSAWAETVEDYATVREAMRGCDRVVHMASLAGVPTVVADPADVMDVILNGTRNVLAAAVLHDVKRVVNVSTSEVYGPYAYRATEDSITSLPPVGESPRWSYAVAKLAAEHLCRSYFDQYEVPVVNVRPCNVYGPGQIGVGAVNNFTRAAVTGEPLLVHGDGSQIRSWCYVDDFTRAVEAALWVSEAVGETFNVGNPHEVSTTRDLAHRIIRQSGSDSRIVSTPIGYPDVEIRVLECGKAERLLDWTPAVDLEAGLERTIAWQRERVHSAAPSTATST